MALIVKDRVKETTTTTGTGTVTLAGAAVGFQSFAIIGNANTTYYAIVDSATGAWEVGIGTYTSSGTLLSRDTVLESSTGGAKISFGAGAKEVFVTYPADRSVSQADVGTAPNQLPLNQYLGNLAYQDAANIAGNVGVGGALTVTGTSTLTGAITTTGVLTLPAGTVSAPALTTTGDTNTGMFFPAADTIAFTEGGAESMRIDSSGRVGIGTSSPVSTLDVTISSATAYSATASGTAFRVANISSSAATNFSSMQFVTDGNGRGIVNLNALNNASASSADFTIQTRHSGTLGERLRIISDGNVGIGTSSPNYRLDVAGNANSVAAGITTAYGTGGEVYSSFRFNNSSFSGGSSEIRNIANGSTTAGSNLAFFTSQTGTGTLTERLRIDTSGNVGIGTSSPASQLTVGAATANPAATVSFFKNTTSEYRLKLTSNGFNADGAWLGLGFGYSDNYMKAAIIAEAKDVNGRANFHFALNDAASSANAGLSDSKMVLTYSGNLIVGTTTPAGASQITAYGASNGQIAVQNSTNWSRLLQNAGDLYIDNGVGGSAGNIIFRSASSTTERGRISSTGVWSLGAAPGSESLRVTPVASAVNYWDFYGSATGGSIAMYATGSDTNINVVSVAKGSAYHFFNSLNATQFRIAATASAVNYLQVTGAATGVAPVVSAQGSDTNIDLALTPKGTGVLAFGTYTAGILAQAGYITIKDAAGNTRNLLVG